MNKNLKKIMVTTMFSVASLSAIGVGQPNKLMSKNNNKPINEISSKTDSKETQQSSNLGKIISASAYNDRQYISPKLQSNSIEENISNQTNTESGFKLFILSNIPFVNISTDENNTTQKTTRQTQTNELNFNNELNLKRSILMVYVNEIKNGNVNLSETDRNEINKHIETINQNKSFENYQTYNLSKTTNSNSTIYAIDSIIKIVEDNLSPTSKFYNSDFSKNYGNFTNTQANISNPNDNISIAQNIANALKMNINTNLNLNNNQPSINQNDNISTLEENYLNNKNTQNSSNISTIEHNNSNLNQNINRNYIQNQQQNTSGHLTKDIKESDRTNTSTTRRNLNNQNITSQTGTPRTIRATRIPERNSTENTVRTTSENNAVRVPYRATNI